jgi:probable rRNA maturation factor
MKNLKIYSSSNVKLDKRKIHNLVFQLTRELEIKLETLELNFVTSETILRINIEYLDHDYLTDIITFNYSGDKENLEGEIFICTEIALENALKYNVNLDSELIRLIIHGILHLIGYDDTKSDKKKKMKIKEDELVKKFEIDHKNVIIRYDS